MIGQRLGSYRVLERLGGGGMGEVYLADHVLIGRRVAIKVLKPEHTSDPEIVSRFFNEARAAAMTRHPGVVEVFDFDWHEGAAYLVMEHLEGEALSARLRREGAQIASLAAWIVRQVASAVGAAHERGIVHRDLKPDNVFLIADSDTPYGIRVKVLDFGIAKLASGVGPHAVRTRTGMLMGTPYYMAPEQCLDAGEVDTRADIYALGCILFEVLTGRPPFGGRVLGEVLRAHISQPPPRPAQLAAGMPPALEQLVLRMLAKAPAERPNDMRELTSILDPLIASLPRAAYRPGMVGAGGSGPAHAATAAAQMPAPAVGAGRMVMAAMNRQQLGPGAAGHAAIAGDLGHAATGAAMGHAPTPAAMGYAPTPAALGYTPPAAPGYPPAGVGHAATAPDLDRRGVAAVLTPAQVAGVGPPGSPRTRQVLLVVAVALVVGSFVAWTALRKRGSSDQTAARDSHDEVATLMARAKVELDGEQWTKALATTARARELAPGDRAVTAAADRAERELRAQGRYQDLQRAVAAKDQEAVLDAFAALPHDSVYRTKAAAAQASARTAVLVEARGDIERLVATRRCDEAAAVVERIRHRLPDSAGDLAALARCSVAASEPAVASHPAAVGHKPHDVPPPGVAKPPAAKPIASPPVLAPTATDAPPREGTPSWSRWACKKVMPHVMQVAALDPIYANAMVSFRNECPQNITPSAYRCLLAARTPNDLAGCQ